MALFLPLVLLGPVLLLLTAVLALGRHGPLGWLAAAGLLVVVSCVARWLVRAGRAWWVSATTRRSAGPGWSRMTRPSGHDDSSAD